jgi:plastocyanin
MVVAVGQTVRWEGALSAHPLAPGNADHPDAGSANSPIVATSSGTSVEFTFSAPGTFPYECQVHSFGDGKGMAGVVHVAP